MDHLYKIFYFDKSDGGTVFGFYFCYGERQIQCFISISLGLFVPSFSFLRVI